jgi:4-amino-4-deoxy-L-arabinose transferase-like glycosyltransferase
MKGIAARNGGRAGLTALAAILLLGVGLRVDDAWEGRAPVYDAAAYARIAANLEHGEGFTLGRTATQPASNYSPGLPLLAAGLYELTGGVHERFARVVLALLGSLAVLFSYLIGRRLWGFWAGLIGATAVAIYPALLEYQGMLMTEPLAATLLSGAVLAMLWADNSSNGPSGRRQDPRARWLVPGVLLGALALTRPEYLAISLPVAVVVFARGGRASWRSCLAQAAIMLVGLALAVAPWTVRNAIALDRFAPISTGGGQVLFAGSYMPSGGDPERVGREVLERHPGLTRQLAIRHGAFPAHSAGKAPLAAVLERVRLEQILARLAAQRYPGVPTDEALARMGRERLWDAVSEHPLDYAGFLTAKLGRIWLHGPRDVMRDLVWEVLHWALLAFGLLGLGVLAWRRRWEALLLATVLVSATAVGELLVATPRRALVTIPLLAALAGVGVAWLTVVLGERLRGRRAPLRRIA